MTRILSRTERSAALARFLDTYTNAYATGRAQIMTEAYTTLLDTWSADVDAANGKTSETVTVTTTSTVRLVETAPERYLTPLPASLAPITHPHNEIAAP